MLSWIWKILGLGATGLDVQELARRLDRDQAKLREWKPVYREFTIPKRSGGKRRIHAPTPELKTLQRRILRRLLARLKTHPAATGFERGESFVTNARRHVGRAVVLRFDVQDFFPSTSARRVEKYFRAIGWNREAARLLSGLCTWEGALPQGAPTSPRLSNLLNYRLDARLSGLAARSEAIYTRYADDLTFSFREDRRDRIGFFSKWSAKLCKRKAIACIAAKRFTSDAAISGKRSRAWWSTSG
jgi:retron-type reverse transcriptase